ncbi:MAG: hypothetical protein ACFBZ9_18645 [Sphingomonadales bacterium]
MFAVSQIQVPAAMISNLIKQLFKILIASSPLLAAMYGLYWLETSGTWVPETPHRDKITIAVLAAAMLASFLIQSRFIRKKR